MASGSPAAGSFFMPTELKTDLWNHLNVKQHITHCSFSCCVNRGNISDPRHFFSDGIPPGLVVSWNLIGRDASRTWSKKKYQFFHLEKAKLANSRLLMNFPPLLLPGSPHRGSGAGGFWRVPHHSPSHRRLGPVERPDRVSSRWHRGHLHAEGMSHSGTGRSRRRVRIKLEWRRSSWPGMNCSWCFYFCEINVCCD